MAWRVKAVGSHSTATYVVPGLAPVTTTDTVWLSVSPARRVDRQRRSGRAGRSGRIGPHQGDHAGQCGRDHHTHHHCSTPARGEVGAKSPPVPASPEPLRPRAHVLEPPVGRLRRPAVVPTLGLGAGQRRRTHPTPRRRCQSSRPVENRPIRGGGLPARFPQRVCPQRHASDRRPHVAPHGVDPVLPPLRRLTGPTTTSGRSRSDGERWGGRLGATGPERRWRLVPVHGAGGAVSRSASR